MKMLFRKKNDKVPKVVIEEPNDKPAARGVLITIFLVMVILVALYFVVFNEFIYSFFFSD